MSTVKLWGRRALQRPGRSAFLLLSLSVAMAGAIAAMSLTAAVSWRALPFYQAASLVKLEVRNSQGEQRWWSWPELEAVSRDDASSLLQGTAGYTVGDVNIASEAGRPPQAVLATMVSSEFIRVLGVRIAIGRSFSALEHQPGSPRVVLLSHELWQRHYGADPQVVGRMITLGIPEYLEEPGGDYLVVGVLAPETWLFSRRSDLVLPFRAHSRLLSNPRERLLEHVVARLDPTATVASARLHTGALMNRLTAAGGADATDRVIIDDLRSALFRDLQPKVRLLLVIAVLVFLSAGVNVIIAASTASLERQRETAVRLAIGAAPNRLARDAGMQLALTAATAAVLAVAVSGWFIQGVLAYLPDAWLARVPGGGDAVRVGRSTIAALGIMTFALTAATAVSMYWRIRRTAVSPLLDAIQHNDAPRRQRWRAALVGSEVALCAGVVLVATTLGLQLWDLRRVDLGVRADRTVAMWINASSSKYADPVARVKYFDRLSEALSRVDGVEAVGAVDLTFNFNWQTTMVRAGVDRASAPMPALERAATSSYLDVSGLTLVDGRWLEAQDLSAAGVAVISRSLADVLWPRERAVGQTLQFDASKAATPLTVVGVVSDIRDAPQALPAQVIYRSVAQSAPPWLYFLIRTRAQADMRNALEQAVWRVEPDQAVDGPWRIQEWIDDTTSYVQFLAIATAMLAGIGIVLAVAGLHALTSYWVEVSRRELGIRRALGARDRDVILWFGAKWARVVAPALLVGLLLQLALLRTTGAQIESVQAASMLHLAWGTCAVGLYAAAAAVAALLRALRANESTLIR